MIRAKNICAVFVAKFVDGYRVIYRMNDEWLLDSPEPSLTAARIKAERCIEVMKSRPECVAGSARIYEVNVAANICDSIRSGLRDKQSRWQQHMDHAAHVLNVKGHVSMASFVTDRDNSQSDPVDDPYLFVVSDDLSTGQHYIDTVRLCEQTALADMGVVHEISHGQACLHVSKPNTDNGFLRFLALKKGRYALSGESVNRI